MTLSIDIPDELETTLREQLGLGLEQSAREELAAAWFRAGKLSTRQVAQFLGLSIFETQAFLKNRKAFLPMSTADVEADLAALHSLPTQ
jgi:predicted HTH domain antitoxin